MELLKYSFLWFAINDITQKRTLKNSNINLLSVFEKKRSDSFSRLEI